MIRNDDGSFNEDATGLRLSLRDFGPKKLFQDETSDANEYGIYISAQSLYGYLQRADKVKAVRDSQDGVEDD